MATDHHTNNDNDLDLCRLALSVSSDSLCATELTALDAKKQVLHRARVLCMPGHTPNLNLTFNRKSKADVNRSHGTATDVTQS